MNRAAVTVLCLLLMGLMTGCGPKDSGPGGGGGGKTGSYTQRILDLDVNQQKEFGIKPPKGAKALFAAGSAEDFIQSLTLFASEDRKWIVVDTSNPDLEPAKSNERHGVKYSYQAQKPGGVLVPKKCWDMIYGPPKDVKTVTENTGGDKRFGGQSPIQVLHWTMTCDDESLLLRSGNTRFNPNADTVRVEFIHFNKQRDSLCPNKGQLRKDVFYKY